MYICICVCVCVHIYNVHTYYKCIIYIYVYVCVYVYIYIVFVIVNCFDKEKAWLKGLLLDQTKSAQGVSINILPLAEAQDLFQI